MIARALAAALLALGALLGAPACSSTPGPGAGGSGSGTGGAGGTVDCSTLTECGDATTDPTVGCVACAESETGPCKDELNRCNQSQDCLAYGRCIEACMQGDTTCVDDCDAADPVGSSLYKRLVSCVVCDACPIACDASGSGCAG